MKIFEHHSKNKNKNDFEEFCKSEGSSILFCVNCCKEGSDIYKLDFGLYLDSVKKRSLLVSMQTAGRIMRPDDAGLKKYAYIIEVINTETNDLSVEIMSVMKLINYYKSILNLANDTEDIDDKNICKNFMDLHSSTHIIESKNEIYIDFGQNINPCIIRTKFLCICF